MMIGKNIKRLRLNKGITQEQLAEVLHLSAQAVSKYENEIALPDITVLPLLADYFGVTIDEIMDYKLNSLTYKERFVKFMIGNGIINFGERKLKSGVTASYYINTENFTTNAQIAKIGEFFADCIENRRRQILYRTRQGTSCQKEISFSRHDFDFCFDEYHYFDFCCFSVDLRLP